MANINVLKQIHDILFELMQILQENNGLKHFPRFTTIYGQVSSAIDDPDLQDDLVFLEDIKLSILGMYSHGGSGCFLDYGIWKDNKEERRDANQRFNELRDELPRLARSLQT